MSLDLIQQTGMTLIDQPMAATEQALVVTAGRNLIVLEHNGSQRIFPGHSKPITAVCATPDSGYLASAQDGCICIWNYESGQAIAIPTQDSCKYMQFSPNSKFLAVIYSSGFVDAFDTKGQKVGDFNNNKRNDATNFVAWGEIPQANPQNNIQFFVTPDHNRIHIHTIIYNRAQLMFNISTESINIPASGLDRTFFCGAICYPNCYCGTAAGEVCVFNLETRVFRQNIKYFSSKIQNILITPDGLLLASQKGDIVTLSGSDVQFNVTSETSIACQIQYADIAIQKLFVVITSGSILSFQFQTKQVNHFQNKQQTNQQFNQQGHVGQLPGQQLYGDTTPLKQHQKATDSVENSPQRVAFYISKDTLEINHAFPASPLSKTDIYQLDTEILIGCTEFGVLQAWQTGVLLTQVKLGGQCGAVCVFNEHVYTAFADILYHFIFTKQEYQLQCKIPISKVTALSCNGRQIAAGCYDGKVFILDAQSLTSLNQITDYYTKVNFVCFDKVVNSIVHVSNAEGFITTYDVLKNCNRLKHRCLGAAAQCVTMTQVDCDRCELVCACLDGTVRFYDFDVQDAVQVVKMPPGCVVKDKLFVDVYGDKLVAGGCYQDADEVLLCMCIQNGQWVPAGSQLSNGVQMISLKLRQQLYITGAGGEVLTFQWK